VELSSNSLDQAVPCFDPDCVDEHGRPSTAEPEQDGLTTSYVCLTCGSEFGYRRLDTHTVATTNDGTCAVGIPAGTRRAASAAMERTLAGERRLPLLAIGRRPDAPAP
jgi:hypothetical protein